MPRVASAADGTQLLNEMLQNADDASAREFRVVLDCRAHALGGGGGGGSGARVLSPAHAAASAGPRRCLLAFDDASFRPSDFSSIQACDLA